MNSSNKFVEMYINNAKTSDILNELMRRNNINKKEAYKIIYESGYCFNRYVKEWIPDKYENDNYGAWEYLFDYMIEKYKSINNYFSNGGIIDEKIINLIYQTIKLNFNIAHDIKYERQYQEIIQVAKRIKA